VRLDARRGLPEGEYVDPSEVLSATFAVERLALIIGCFPLAKKMKAQMQEGDEDKFSCPISGVLLWLPLFPPLK
jgi:hypothetical protein